MTFKKNSMYLQEACIKSDNPNPPIMIDCNILKCFHEFQLMLKALSCVKENLYTLHLKSP